MFDPQAYGSTTDAIEPIAACGCGCGCSGGAGGGGGSGSGRE